MENADTKDEVYEDVYADLGDSVNRLQRTLMASILAMYPNRDELASFTETLCDDIGADAIQVNVILPGKQLTIVSTPDGATTVREIPSQDSLCVLTVSENQPMKIDDMKKSPFLKNHSSKDAWGAWCSAPIRINMQPVGTVCALMGKSRKWTKEDEAMLVATAKSVETTVLDWIQDRGEEKKK